MKIYKLKKFVHWKVFDTSDTSILKDLRLNGNEVRFMLWMLSMSPTYTYSHERVAEKMGLTKKTVITMVKHLEELKYIRKIPKGPRNLYEYEFYEKPYIYNLCKEEK